MTLNSTRKYLSMSGPVGWTDCVQLAQPTRISYCPSHWNHWTFPQYTPEIIHSFNVTSRHV